MFQLSKHTVSESDIVKGEKNSKTRVSDLHRLQHAEQATNVPQSYRTTQIWCSLDHFQS